MTQKFNLWKDFRERGGMIFQQIMRVRLSLLLFLKKGKELNIQSKKYRFLFNISKLAPIRTPHSGLKNKNNGSRNKKSNLTFSRLTSLVPFFLPCSLFYFWWRLDPVVSVLPVGGIFCLQGTLLFSSISQLVFCKQGALTEKTNTFKLKN